MLVDQAPHGRGGIERAVAVELVCDDLARGTRGAHADLGPGGGQAGQDAGGVGSARGACDAEEKPHRSRVATCGVPRGPGEREARYNPLQATACELGLPPPLVSTATTVATHFSCASVSVPLNDGIGAAPFVRRVTASW